MNAAEFVTVKVNGVVRQQKVDHDLNECRVKDLGTILNKNKCCDIFLNIKRIVNDQAAEGGDGQEKVGACVNHGVHVHRKALRVQR